MLLAAIAWACTGPPTPPPSTPELEEMPDLDAEIPAEVPDPTSALLLSIAAGTRPPGSLLDDKRGFVWVEVDGSAPDDARAGPDGRLRIAERVCGAEAEQRLAILRQDLASRTQQGTIDVFDCRGPVCAHAARTPDDVAGSYAFQAPDGTHVLGVVVRMRHPPSRPREQQDVENWVDEQLHDLTGVPCP